MIKIKNLSKDKKELIKKTKITHKSFNFKVSTEEIRYFNMLRRWGQNDEFWFNKLVSELPEDYINNLK